MPSKSGSPEEQKPRSGIFQHRLTSYLSCKLDMPGRPGKTGKPKIPSAMTQQSSDANEQKLYQYFKHLSKTHDFNYNPEMDKVKHFLRETGHFGPDMSYINAAHVRHKYDQLAKKFNDVTVPEEMQRQIDEEWKAWEGSKRSKCWRDVVS